MFRSIVLVFAVLLVAPPGGVAQGTDFALPDAVAIDYGALLAVSDRIGFAETALRAPSLLGDDHVGAHFPEVGGSPVDPFGLDIRAFRLPEPTDVDQIARQVGDGLGLDFRLDWTRFWRGEQFWTAAWRRDGLIADDVVVALVIDGRNSRWDLPGSRRGLPREAYLIVYAPAGVL